MKISYNWLNEYLPVRIETHELAGILTAIGLEVEGIQNFESVKGSLEGVVIGKIKSVIPHPNADKLKLTKVDIGEENDLNIVCGAANVAAGQTVAVAKSGTTLYPANGEPLTLKKTKIRGEISEGMICAEDELGLGRSHEGIMVLPDEITAGTKASDVFNIYTDVVFEIGLTPNRMDAMSHYGVARDVLAYYNYHNKQQHVLKNPFKQPEFSMETNKAFKALVLEENACSRYSGILITNVQVHDSPEWLKNKLLAIDQRPINNIVDITNYILHATGQPLHAFDADKIQGNQIIVKMAEEESAFTTLDEKSRTLSKNDLMICDAEKPLCIAGVFGGNNSGVTEKTKNIFLESAVFDPINIRQTSLNHHLRTDAALRFEKGIDISNTRNVLLHAAALIQEVTGAKISGHIIDVYPKEKVKKEITLNFAYLKKLSGKNYDAESVQTILKNLGFEVKQQTNEALTVLVPFYKTDVSIPADLVEEIIRIDGIDNIPIPTAITITPAINRLAGKESVKEKICSFLSARGLKEIVTNSISNSKFYNEQQLEHGVKMINSLSAELDVLKPSMLESGLQAIAYNINRKKSNLQFFELGKTYSTNHNLRFNEKEWLAIYITGNLQNKTWKNDSESTDFYYVKGLAEALLKTLGIKDFEWHEKSKNCFSVSGSKEEIGFIEMAAKHKLNQFDIKQPVFFACLDLNVLVKLSKQNHLKFKPLSRFPFVERDIAMIIDKSITFGEIQKVVHQAGINRLKEMHLFDVFISEKLGIDKKSMAIKFNFMDEEKTLTDSETDSMMNKLMKGFEKELNAEIRKS